MESLLNIVLRIYSLTSVERKTIVKFTLDDVIIDRMCSIFRFETYNEATNIQLQNIRLFVKWPDISLFSKQKTTLSMRCQ